MYSIVVEVNDSMRYLHQTFTFHLRVSLSSCPVNCKSRRSGCHVNVQDDHISYVAEKICPINVASEFPPLAVHQAGHGWVTQQAFPFMDNLNNNIKFQQDCSKNTTSRYCIVFMKHKQNSGDCHSKCVVPFQF